MVAGGADGGAPSLGSLRVKIIRRAETTVILAQVGETKQCVCVCARHLGFESNSEDVLPPGGVLGLQPQCAEIGVDEHESA